MGSMDDPRKQVVASGYDRMAEHYLEWSRSIEGDPRHSMVARLSAALEPGARVLELGCGAGVPSTRELARTFAVVGVDISSAQVELARQQVPEAELLHGDFMEMDFAEASFDGVVALYAISHVPRELHAQLFADVFRWLAPGGLFLATLGATDIPDWVGTWLGEQMLFSSYGAEENRRLLRAAGFGLELDEVQVTPEPDGDVSFLWVIARKPAGAEATERASAQ
jgi:ubiquinone/menaquinone biosynthesis C-methylase UbiE